MREGQAWTLCLCPGQDAAAGGSGPAHGSLRLPGLPRGDRALTLLGQQSRGLKAAWEQRQQRLQGRPELQRSGREVDGFSANCALHEAFLQLDSLGVWSQGCAAWCCSPIAGGCLEARLGGRPLRRHWVRGCDPHALRSDPRSPRSGRLWERPRAGCSGTRSLSGSWVAWSLGQRLWGAHGKKLAQSQQPAAHR